MKQKPSFSTMTGQPIKSRLSALPQKNVSGGKPSLADLMNQYEETEYSTISLKMDSDAPKLQLQVEEKHTGPNGFSAVGDEWFRKQQQSPLRLHNKENINDQAGHRKKSIHEVQRFGDCVKELDKKKHITDHSQDEDLSAFQPRTAVNKSPLRGKYTNPTSSLLRHAEEDLVFRAKAPESKPINFTQLSKRFNGEATPTQLQKQPQTRSRSKLAPKIQKQFRQSEESEHEQETVSLKESIIQNKNRVFQFHNNMRHQQKEQLERKVHQITQENVKILAGKKNTNGTKMLPKVIEDMKLNVAKQIEEFARSRLMDAHKEPETHFTNITEKKVATFHQHLQDSKQNRVIQQTKTYIRNNIDVKDKNVQYFEEENIRHTTLHTQQPKLISNVISYQKETEKARLQAINQQIVRQIQLEQQREQRRLSLERRQLRQEEQQKRFIEDENQRIVEEQGARKREWEYAESQRLRIHEQQKLRMIQLEQARMIAEVQRIRQHQLEEERLRIQQRRLIEMRHEETEKLRLYQLQEQKLKRIQQENAEAELIKIRALEEEALSKQLSQIRRIEEERAQQAEKQRLKREEQRQQLVQIELTRRAEQERLEAEHEHQKRIEQGRRLEIEMEEQRKRRLEQQREQNERMRIKLLEQEQFRKKQLFEQERIHRQIEQRAHQEARDLQDRLKQQKEIEEARERERLLDLEKRETQRRQRLRLQQENTERVEKERLDRIAREREEAQINQQRQRVTKFQKEHSQKSRLQEHNQEEDSIRVIEEEKLRKIDIEKEDNKQENLKLTSQISPILPETTINVISQKDQMRTSLKVESLFSNYSIFPRQPQPQATPQDRINKLFDKTRNDKALDVDFKFDFGLDLGLDEEPKKKASFDNSVINSKDRLPSYGTRRR